MIRSVIQQKGTSSSKIALKRFICMK